MEVAAAAEGPHTIMWGKIKEENWLRNEVSTVIASKDSQVALSTIWGFRNQVQQQFIIFLS